ncbi:c-type cytochrome [Edaphobacter acidisoli]|nr:c-type cytochrome [Edaphobacter acidisoli]
MLHRNLSRALIASSLLFPSTCLLAQNAPAAAPQEGMHHEMPKPTNLQILPKDISTKDLMAVMHDFTGDLGVHCTFCHEVNAQTHKPDFASDAKHEKVAARVMMQMTHEINTKYLAELPHHEHAEGTEHEARVSCSTCHQGHPEPPKFTPPPEEHHGPPPAPPSN